jgi:hypothetical protein
MYVISNKELGTLQLARVLTLRLPPPLFVAKEALS